MSEGKALTPKQLADIRAYASDESNFGVELMRKLLAHIDRVSAERDALHTCYDGLLETGNKILAERDQLAAEAERLRAEIAQHKADNGELFGRMEMAEAQLAQAQADARRFVLLIDQLKPDEINHVDLHEAAAQIAADIGPYDAPTDEDYLNAARAAIDSALSNQRGEKA